MGAMVVAYAMPMAVLAAQLGMTEVSIDNPLAQVSFCQLMKALLNLAIVLAIPVMVGALVYSGFKFALARGNEAAIRTAKGNLLFTLIGIALFLGAWTLAQLVGSTINSLQRAGGNPGGVIISC